MHFITVYDEQGDDHLVNTAHIVRITYNGTSRPVVWLTSGHRIGVTGTPEVPQLWPLSQIHLDQIHQSILDQLTAITERNHA